MDFLNAGKVKYQVIHHPEAFTAQELAAVEGVKGKSHAKVVMVKSDGELFMTVVPADHRLDLEQLGSVLGRRVDLASEEEFREKFPDCATGTMPPFGQLYGLPLYMDRSLQTEGPIVFEAGTHSDAIRMNFTDYHKLAQPKSATFAVKLH
jgi:Ala-tRNA(Pro) deacylase